MLESELIQLLDTIRQRRCEMQNIELKKAAKGTPAKLYDTMSGFANQTNGGIIVFGVDESADFAVTGVYDAQDLQVQVTNAALQMEPPVRPVFTAADLDGKTVIAAEIPECPAEEKPCFYRAAGRIRGSYVRVGDADLPMTEYEVYAYEAFRRKIRDELRQPDEQPTAEFDPDLLGSYFIRLRQAKPILAGKADSLILRLQGLTRDDRPTLAGLMLLSDYPQACFPQLCITAMAVSGTEIGRAGSGAERFTDNRRIEGCIPRMLEDALAFVRRNTKTAVVIDADGRRVDRTEYPMVAVREVILNALIHRDYSVHTEDSPIRLILYSDRLTVENPGGLYGRLTINDLVKLPADTRNPFIAGSLEVMLCTENRFSGIPTIRAEMASAGLRPPVFESFRGMFRVTLYNSPAESTVKNGSGTGLEEKILRFCSVPRTKTEIAEHLGLTTVYYLTKRYLKPLTADGRLKPVSPGQPGSRNQRYITVKQ